MDARRLLGVRPGATPEEIRRAFARAVRVVHPDAGGDETLAGERLDALVRARDQLLAEHAWPGARTSGGAPSPRPVPPAASSRVEAFVLALARFIARRQGGSTQRRPL